MTRILHAADFHLDSAFGALSESRAKIRRQESRNLVEQMIRYANEHDVELMLLAGDLFDSDRYYPETAESLCNAFSKFQGQIVIAPGNHDYYHRGSAYHQMTWPENVHFFTGEFLEKIVFPEYNCVVWGAAFNSFEAQSLAIENLTREENGMTNILVMHADVGVANSKYRPLTCKQIQESCFDYIALGHQHTYSGIQKEGNVCWAYPGCLEGHGFDEAGEKGFILGNVDAEEVHLKFVPFACRQYKILTVDANEPELPENLENDLVRVLLTGETKQPISVDEYRKRWEGKCYHLEIQDCTSIAKDLWAGAGEETLRGLFLRELKEKLDKEMDPNRRALIENAARFGIAALERREL